MLLDRKVWVRIKLVLLYLIAKISTFLAQENHKIKCIDNFLFVFKLESFSVRSTSTDWLLICKLLFSGRKLFPYPENFSTYSEGSICFFFKIIIWTNNLDVVFQFSTLSVSPALSQPSSKELFYNECMCQTRLFWSALMRAL